jgi:tripartite-type tricarboxylate transporter receptor subunit TctC
LQIIQRLAWAIVLAVSVLASTAQAQTFPTKGLRLIVTFPPGGAADVTGRILAEHMTKGLGQPVIVDNRPGGGSVIGYELGARAPADGHTMLMVWPSFVLGPALRQGLPYDPLRDFKAVGQTISLPMAIAVSPSIPAKNLQELVGLARAKPGEIAYGTSGAGGVHHIFGEMLNLAAKASFTHAPYQGEVPALTSVVGGHLPMVLVNASAIAPFAKSGKVRALAVTSAERLELMPEVPTLRESGYPDLVALNWSGIVVPAATPPTVIARLNAELVRALRQPEVQEKFRSYGMVPLPSTPEQFGTYLQSESAKFAKVVREANIKVD